MRISVFAGWVVLVSLVTRAACGADLVMVGPRSCSREAELRVRVERALGQPLSGVPARRCTVQVVRDGGSYAARLDLASEQSARSRQRAFSGKTCGKLMDMLELAVVLALGEDTSVASARAASAQPASARPASAGLGSPPATVAPPPRPAPGLPRAASSNAPRAMQQRLANGLPRRALPSHALPAPPPRRLSPSPPRVTASVAR